MASYSDDVCATDRYALGKRVGLERGIIIGAEWRINSVWHNVSDTPNFSFLPILAKHKKGQIHFIDSVPSSWNYIKKYYTIWAYIDDLTPKEE